VTTRRWRNQMVEWGDTSAVRVKQRLNQKEKKMRLLTYLTSACLTLLATMALAQSVTYDYDRAADFSKYKTYAWTRGTELADPLNHARIVRAIDDALGAKGLARVESSASPDVLVAYHASFDRNLEITGSAHGGGPFGLGGDG